MGSKEQIERKCLENLTMAVKTFLAALDKVMESPTSYEKGKQIAKLTNDLNLANDLAIRFGLGIDYHELRKGKKP